MATHSPTKQVVRINSGTSAISFEIMHDFVLLRSSENMELEGLSPFNLKDVT